MYISPYHTTACKAYRMNKTLELLEKEVIEGNLVPVGDHGMFFMVSHQSTHVPPFNHPIVEKNKDDYTVVVDPRSITTIDRHTQEYRPNNNFSFLLNSAHIIRHHWIDGQFRDLYAVSDLPMMIFAKLISETLARRLNLDIQVQSSIEILAAYYYIALFEDDLPTKEEDLFKYARTISRTTHLPLDRILTMLSNPDFKTPMHTINDFVDRLKESGLSVRLEKLSVGILYTMLGGMWYGPNPTETVAVALEYPPTWISMLYAISSSRNYNKTVIAQLIQREDRRSKLRDSFVLNVKRLLDDSILKQYTKD